VYTAKDLPGDDSPILHDADPTTMLPGAAFLLLWDADPATTPSSAWQGLEPPVECRPRVARAARWGNRAAPARSCREPVAEAVDCASTKGIERGMAAEAGALREKEEAGHVGR
jgi:hypothetical protein